MPRVGEEPECLISRSEVLWRVGMKLQQMSIDAPEIAGHKLYDLKDTRNAIYKAIYSVPIEGYKVVGES